MSAGNLTKPGDERVASRQGLPKAVVGGLLEPVVGDFIALWRLYHQSRNPVELRGTWVVEDADVEVHAHDSGDQRARQEDYGGEREFLQDLIGTVAAAGDQYVERVDGAFAGIACRLQRADLAPLRWHPGTFRPEMTRITRQRVSASTLRSAPTTGGGAGRG